VAGSSEGRAFELPFTLGGTALPPCPSDLDGDRDVSGSDLALALLDFGPCPGCPSDVDGSEEVDAGDLAVMLLDFGPCP